MKRYLSVFIYGLIACLFAGLSFMPHFFENLNLEQLATSLFSIFGVVIGFAISLTVLIHLAKSFVEMALEALRKQGG